MCLVRVFIFVKKAEQMYEITIFKSAMHREERRDEMRVQRGEETKIKKKLIRWVRAQSKKVDKCFSPSVYCLKSAPATFQNILFKHGFWSNNFQTTLFWTPWPNIFFQILDTSVQCLNTEQTFFDDKFVKITTRLVNFFCRRTHCCLAFFKFFCRRDMFSFFFYFCPD